MALNQKQQEIVQKIKDEIDKIELMKAKLRMGEYFPAQVPDYQKKIKRQTGYVNGLIDASLLLATDKQYDELKESITSYTSKLQYGLGE